MPELLITNGCGLTRGAELATPDREAWPAVLGGLLGIPVVNLGCDGGSNRRTVRTTVTYLDRLCDAANVAVDRTLVVCLWTRVDRTERFRSHRRERDGSGPPVVGPPVPYEQAWQPMDPAQADRNPASRAHYRHLHSEAGATANWLLDWLMLDGFLAARGTAVRYAYGYDGPTRAVGGPVRELADLLEAGRVAAAVGDSFVRISRRHGFEFGPGGHPLRRAHAYFAGLLAGSVSARGVGTGRAVV